MRHVVEEALRGGKRQGYVVKDTSSDKFVTMIDEWGAAEPRLFRFKFTAAWKANRLNEAYEPWTFREIGESK